MSKSKVRILHVIPSTDLGGISSFVMNIYREIDRDHIQFDFVAFNKGVLHDEIISLGGRVFYCDYIKKQGPVKFIKGIREKIQTNGPYIAVHSHQSYKSGFALLAAKLEKIDIRITHTHAVKPEKKWHNLILQPLKWFSIRNATKLVTCSTRGGDAMYGNRKYYFFPNSIPLESFLDLNNDDAEKTRKEIGMSSTTILVGHVGRFVQVKNHKFIINIALELKKIHPDFKMVFIGEGPLLNQTKSYVKEKALEENVMFLGQRPDVNKLMNAMDIFILPSLFESFPFVLLEAQASKLPSLVSTEVPKDVDINAGLLDYEQLGSGAEEWAKSLLKIHDENIRETKREVNIEKYFVREKYDIASNVDRILKLYGL